MQGIKIGPQLNQYLQSEVFLCMPAAAGPAVIGMRIANPDECPMTVFVPNGGGDPVPLPAGGQQQVLQPSFVWSDYSKTPNAIVTCNIQNTAGTDAAAPAVATQVVLLDQSECSERADVGPAPCRAPAALEG